MKSVDWMNELTDHHRYPYHGLHDLPHYRWPDGKHLAVYIAMNLEHFSFSSPEGAKLSQVANKLDVLNYSWRDYGNRVGAWHLADLFKELAIPASVICNTSILDYAPNLINVWLQDKRNELIAHGHTNSQRQGGLSTEAENQMIEMCQNRLTAYSGKAIDGWLSPWISESQLTPELLNQNGFKYTLNWAHDDRPVEFATATGPLLSIPYPQEINDIPTIIPNGASIERFCRMIRDQLLELMSRQQGPALVMGIALHPYIVGQPFRFYHLKKILREISEMKNEFWLTTPGEIYKYHREKTAM